VSSISELQDRSAVRGSYFFLSYAHSPPLAGTLQADPDRWVRTFFHDLSKAVSQQAGDHRLEVGSFDQEIALSPGWKASIKRALSSAEVFVPLLSPGYYTRSWPGKEWSSFDQRLVRAGLRESERAARFEPVLWIPLPGEPDLPGLRKALALGAGEPGYAENGLRALLRLAPYRETYLRVVARLAQRIIAVTSTEPLAPSAVSEFDLAPSPFLPVPGTAVFGVYIAAPGQAEVPPDRDPRGYGIRGTDWRAYPAEQELPLADYAVQVAEQLDFTVTVSDVQQPAGQDSPPSVVLIDPWYVASQLGYNVLRQFAKSMPMWVLPLVVLDPTVDVRAAELARRVRTIFSGSVPHAEPVSRAINGVSSLREFVSLMPVLVTEAQRRYLRHGPVVRSTETRRFWPRLTGTAAARQHQEHKDV
jgi:FxsC-like protein